MRSGSLTSPTLHMMSVREDDVAKGFETRALPEIPHSASRAGSPNVQQEINDEADEEDSEVEVRRTTRPKLRKKRRTNVRMPHRQVAVESIIITTDDEAPGGYVAKLEAKSFDTGRLTRRNSRRDSVAPSESVSVRAIRRHKSRKEKPAPLEPMPMPKRNPTQKRQKNNSNVKQLGPFRPQSEFGHGTIIIATTPSIVDFNDQSRRASFQNSSPGGPDSNYEPSLLASSDALGPIQRSDLRLKESALREVARVDPLENVKQFLTHQHLQHLEEHRVSPPPVPNKTNQERIRANAMQMPPRSQSAAAMRISPFGSATIGPSAVSAPLVQPLRSQTPSVPLGQPLRSQTPSCGLRIQGMEQVIPPYNFVAAASSRGISPGMMRTTTPFSEADVPCPTSTTPFNFRDQSQSVPPDMMHYRRFPTPTIESLTAPIMPRSAGFRVENASLRSVDENAEWEEVKDEVKMAPSPNLRTHSGWMKKRRTNWFRHEWPDHHFVLQGTRLGYANDVATTEVGAIDMDEYQVACSNSGSTKLSAAFKAGRIFGKKKEDGITGSYFFQLVPAENKGGKRGLGKVHCFSVNTREERIDWMRELMLAKAIKQKGQGFEVEVNGERV